MVHATLSKSGMKLPFFPDNPAARPYACSEPGRRTGFGGVGVGIPEVSIDSVAEADEARFHALMQAHHHLGALRPVGGTVRCVARHRGRWLVPAVFPAPALRCGARDRWIGRDRSLRSGRLHPVPDGSRFPVLPGAPRSPGPRVLSPVARRIVHDRPRPREHPPGVSQVG